jgi:hypothetical protein
MAIVYQHRRKDNNKVFYVGIGKHEKRAFNKSRRYKPWKDLIKNHDYIVEITHKDIIWEEACAIEKYLIAFYGRRDLGLGELVNMTDGGEGVKNLSQESRSKMAVNKGMFGELNYFYGKKHNGDLSRFGIQNIGKEAWSKGKKLIGEKYSIGGKKNKGKIPSNANSICINKDNVNKYIKKEILEDYIKLGWSLGGKVKNKKHE